MSTLAVLLVSKSVGVYLPLILVNSLRLVHIQSRRILCSPFLSEINISCHLRNFFFLKEVMKNKTYFWSVIYFLKESGRADVLVKSLRTPNAKLNPVDFNDFDLMDSLKLEEVSPHQNKHLTSDSKTVLPVDRFLDTETSQVSIQTNVDVASLKPVSDNAFNSTDAPWSPTSEGQTCECYELVGKTKDREWAFVSFFFLNKNKKYVKYLYTF